MFPLRALAISLFACSLSGEADGFVVPPNVRALGALGSAAGCRQMAGAAPGRISRGGLGRAAMQQRSTGSAAGQNQIVRFQAADMEILRQVGEMGYATITDWEYYQGRNPLDPNQPLRTVDQAGPAVRLWEAKVARGPLKNSRMLLKEYLPAAREVAEQELRVYTDLVDTVCIDFNRHVCMRVIEGVCAEMHVFGQFPMTEDFGEAPVATLRGWFKTSTEVRTLRFRTEWQERFPRAPVPRAGNIWLAFRWDSFKPMSGLLASSASFSFLLPGRLSTWTKKIERATLSISAPRSQQQIETRPFIGESPK